MRKKLIAGNWKMNKTANETKEFFEELKKYDLNKDVNMVICPPFSSLDRAVNAAKDIGVAIGAQNMSDQESGAFTGEISANMLLDLGVEYVILGHSERREIFNEQDGYINSKVRYAIEKNLIPILCIGETLEEREADGHFDKVKSQIEKDFENISAEDAIKVIIAYEPIWAIGTGKTATAKDASEMCHFIREEIKKMYNDEVANNISILYGGSVKPANVNELMNAPDIDGALVGGASLKAEDYSKLVNF
ncbi:MAG: triose-phosphate isomerase [Tissierellia bacterium]|nr:triose-phosphate isomerase [Tissierellia bacterium]